MKFAFSELSSMRNGLGMTMLTKLLEVCLVDLSADGIVRYIAKINRYIHTCTSTLQQFHLELNLYTADCMFFKAYVDFCISDYKFF